MFYFVKDLPYIIPAHSYFQRFLSVLYLTYQKLELHMTTIGHVVSEKIYYIFAIRKLNCPYRLRSLTNRKQN